MNVLLWSWLGLASMATAATAASDKQTVSKSVSEANATTTANMHKSGIASYYHNKFVGRKTSNGEVFSNSKYTAASNHFSLGTYVKVTNVSNGKHIYVKINDRMGHAGRIIDLTERAAKDLAFHSKGTTSVKVEKVNPIEGKRRVLAQLNGNIDMNDNQL